MTTITTDTQQLHPLQRRSGALRDPGHFELPPDDSTYQGRLTNRADILAHYAEVHGAVPEGVDDEWLAEAHIAAHGEYLPGREMGSHDLMHNRAVESLKSHRRRTADRAAQLRDAERLTGLTTEVLVAAVRKGPAYAKTAPWGSIDDVLHHVAAALGLERSEDVSRDQLRTKLVRLTTGGVLLRRKGVINPRSAWGFAAKADVDASEDRADRLAVFKRSLEERVRLFQGPPKVDVTFDGAVVATFFRRDDYNAVAAGWAFLHRFTAQLEKNFR